MILAKNYVSIGPVILATSVSIGPVVLASTSVYIRSGDSCKSYDPIGAAIRNVFIGPVILANYVSI